MNFRKPTLKVTTAPASEPVTLANLKLFIRQYDTTHDTLLTSLLTTVRMMAEEYQNRAYITQTLTLTFDYLPYNWFELPRPPFVSITSITFTPETGAATTMSSTTDFLVDTTGMVATMRIKDTVSYPTDDPRDYACLSIVYTAGGTTISEHVKTAICMGVQHLFDKPTEEMPDAFYRLLDLDRSVVPI